MPVREELCDRYSSDLLFADGFDSAIIGVATGLDFPRVVYSTEKMEKLLVEQGMTIEDAIEYLEFNTYGAYVGKDTPIYVSNSDD
jgi:hypothetical protein